MKTKKLLIFGTGGIGLVAYDAFENDSEFHVSAFIVEKAYRKEERFCGLPIVNLEEMESIFPPQDYYFFVAIAGNSLNALRTRLYQALKEKGYTPASYISSKATVSKLATLGEHCCLFENVVIHAGSTLGNNNMILPNAVLGEHCRIENHCFLAANVVLAGYVHLEDYCYIGANATVLNCVVIHKGSVLGGGAVATKDVEADTLIRMQAPLYFEKAKERFAQWFQKVSKKAR